MNPFTILAVGFLLGLKHATDADHVAAVTTIVSRARKLTSAAMIGISWGIGHTMMIIVVGIAIILFHVSIPEKLQLSFEFVVAIALVVLGILNLTGIMQKLLGAFSGIHNHAHQHDNMHIHAHYHDASLHGNSKHHEAVAEFITQHGIFQLMRPLIVGIIHGLAGSAAVALLVLGSISDRNLALLYLCIFGIGTIMGMMLITTILGGVIITGSRKFETFDRAVTVLSGIISIIYGLYFGYHIGIVEGLFTSP